MNGEDDTDRILWLVLGAIRVSRDLFTDLTAGKATVRTFLPRLLTAASRIEYCTYRKIITYQTPQSNLPNV